MVTVEKIYKKKDYFTEISWYYLDRCLRYYDRDDYLYCALWGESFLESLLKDCLSTYDCNIADNERLLNVINDLNNLEKDIPSSDHDKPLLLDIAARSDQVRRKRNEIVYTKGNEDQVLANDANIIYQEIIKIIDDYLRTKISDDIFQSNTKDKIVSN